MLITVEITQDSIRNTTWVKIIPFILDKFNLNRFVNLNKGKVSWVMPPGRHMIPYPLTANGFLWSQ